MTQVQEIQEQIVSLLEKTQRKGMVALIEYLVNGSFFTSPASTRWHGTYEGGLAEHSLAVFVLLSEYNTSLKLGVDPVSVVITTLLHDVCKMGAYIKNTNAPLYHWNKLQPKGHALLSLIRICEYIELNELEIYMIRYHMGLYGLKEFDPMKGEYTLRNKGLAYAWYHYPICKVMYFCDELATLAGT